MADQSVDYTCPMHSDVHSAAPGTCSKCGMALEPATHHGAGDEDSIRLPNASADCAG